MHSCMLPELFSHTENASHHKEFAGTGYPILYDGCGMPNTYGYPFGERWDLCVISSDKFVNKAKFVRPKEDGSMEMHVAGVYGGCDSADEIEPMRLSPIYSPMRTLFDNYKKFQEFFHRLSLQSGKELSNARKKLFELVRDNQKDMYEFFVYSWLSGDEIMLRGPERKEFSFVVDVENDDVWIAALGKMNDNGEYTVTRCDSVAEAIAKCDGQYHTARISPPPYKP